MTSPTSKDTEERLLEIKRRAGESAPLLDGTPWLTQIAGRSAYYGLPALKPPVWTWEVPLYFFLGGISGVSACMAFVAQLFRSDPELIRLLLRVAFLGAMLCPVLLIADLGRPARFLNMLRVFKWRSPMSMGAWILIAFSLTVSPALFSHELLLRGTAWGVLFWVRFAAEAASVFTGLLLAGYTGVLLGATAIPVWSANRRVLPIHFLSSGLGGASGILELAGFLVPASQFLGFASSGVETLLALLFEVQKKEVDAPLHRGLSGSVFRLAALLQGPAALLIRLFWGTESFGRYAAAISFLAGSLLSRYVWIWAGRVSARQPETEFARQRAGGAKP